MSYTLAKKLVFDKVRKSLGMDCCRVCYTSAAPISQDVVSYLGSLDILLCEIYGMSETTGPHTLAVPGDWIRGFAGHAPEGADSKVDDNNGELLVRGRHVFMGYLKDAVATANALDDQGYFHTGDIAEIKTIRVDKKSKTNFEDKDRASPRKYIRITGRLKELIITAGGENVSPVLIEDNVKACMPVVSFCVLIGDKKRFLSILLTIKQEASGTGNALSNDGFLAKSVIDLGKKMGSNASTIFEMTHDPIWKKYFDDGICKANALSAANAQSVKVWRILSTDFSVETDELTPTMKLKRNVICEKYRDVIDDIYE